MGTGPAAGPGYDLALTERIDDNGHRFVVEAGTESGAAVLAEVAHRTAATAEVDEARNAVSTAAGRMGRAMPEVDLRALLRDARSRRLGGRRQPVPDLWKLHHGVPHLLLHHQ